MINPDLSFLPADIADIVWPLLDEPNDIVFDGDGTLWAGDVGEEFLKRVDGSRALPKFPHGGAWEAYLRVQTASMDAAYEFSTTVLEGMTEREILFHAQSVVAQMANSFYEPMKRLVDVLHQMKQRVWVVSASNVWCVRYAAGCLGIPVERVLAVNLLLGKGGRYSSEVVRPAPIGRGKAEAIRSAGFYPALAAGNNIHDKALLESAPVAFVVTPAISPDQDVLELAGIRNWPILRV